MVSIIVPVYNAEAYITDCLNSLVNQTYRDIEIILVDDGSTDGTKNICAQYAAKDERIKVITQKNAGVANARNQGLMKAKGTYITFCDSDDFMNITMIEDLVTLLRDYDADIAATNFCRLLEDGSEMLNDTENQRFALYGRRALYAILGDKRIESYFWNKLFKKELFDKVFCPTNMNLCEDLYVLTKILATNDVKLIYDPKPRYKYRILENSLSATNKYLFDENEKLKYITAFEKVMQIEGLDRNSVCLLKSRCFEVGFSHSRRQFMNTGKGNSQIRMTLRLCKTYFWTWMTTGKIDFAKMKKLFNYIKLYIQTMEKY